MDGKQFLRYSGKCSFALKNNPFNYTHAEDAYIANPNAKILIDYGLYNIPRASGDYLGAIVAAYEMNSGKGKVIHTGIWGHTIVTNKEFIDYFKNVIIPLSVNSTSYESAVKYFE